MVDLERSDRSSPDVIGSPTWRTGEENLSGVGFLRADVRISVPVNVADSMRKSSGSSTCMIGVSLWL